MAKRKTDPYAPDTVWYKIKNRAYTQMEGRWELFQKRADQAIQQQQVLDSCSADPYRSYSPRQRHTRRKPGPQRHGSSLSSGESR